MRKIESDLIRAINTGAPFNAGNTRIDRVGDDLRVRLHGNLIACREHGLWTFCLAGWNTSTTRSRINAIAHEYGAHGVCTRAGIAYSNARAVSDNEWF
jgi:hypothetical protein